MTANGDLEAAYEHCARVVKASAKNFYYAFAILPRERRRAMFALYAFCREADDIVDEGGTREKKRAALARFRGALDAAYGGRPEGPIFTALADVLRRAPISKRHLSDVIDGCEMDLDRERYETWDDLALYLDRVASAVGRATMELFGLDPEKLSEYGAAGGASVQLTNILRDVREDKERGRVYLPQEDLRRFGVPEEDLAAAAPTERFRALMRFEVGRARELYCRAWGAIPDRDRRTLLPLEAIMRIYRRLLDAIEKRGYDVLSARISVPGWRKAAIGIGTLARARLGLRPGR
jgi:phytoene synthase